MRLLISNSLDSLRRKNRKFGHSEQRGLTLRFHDTKINPTFVPDGGNAPLTGGWKDVLLNSHTKHKIAYFFGNRGFLSPRQKTARTGMPIANIIIHQSQGLLFLCTVRSKGNRGGYFR